jgi:hypothetical protein
MHRAAPLAIALYTPHLFIFLRVWCGAALGAVLAGVAGVCQRIPRFDEFPLREPWGQGRVPPPPPPQLLCGAS